ncbi:MAG: hypothetical protein IPO19_00120 [Rhodoferax sp.]|nr:hypothetical protein [Rhodoferax sp.]
MRQRLAEVDALRGCRCIGVVLYHYTTRFQEVFSPATAPTIAFTMATTG